MPRGRPPLPALSPALFIKAGEALFGNQWQAEMARQLNIKDPRNVHQMASALGTPGARSIRMGLARDLAALIATRKRALREVEQELVAEIARLDGDDMGL
jgi:hypothetical protein